MIILHTVCIDFVCSTIDIHYIMEYTSSTNSVSFVGEITYCIAHIETRFEIPLPVLCLCPSTKGR